MRRHDTYADDCSPALFTQGEDFVMSIELHTDDGEPAEPLSGCTLRMRLSLPRVCAFEFSLQTGNAAGELPEGIHIYTDTPGETVVELKREFTSTLTPGDYFLTLLAERQGRHLESRTQHAFTVVATDFDQ